MKSKIKIILIVVIFSGLGIYYLMGSSEARKVSSFEDICTYLRKANSIRISTQSYDFERKIVLPPVVISESKSVSIISDFVDLLENEMHSCDVKTTIEYDQPITANYKVELQCERYVSIDFALYDKSYKVNMRNSDYIFFAELTKENADNFKIFFNMLK